MKVSEHGWIYAMIAAAVVMVGLLVVFGPRSSPDCCKKRGCECVEVRK